ncbi:MAG: tRNA lysidine(34) synthetase TilS [Marmoricola sp.]
MSLHPSVAAVRLAVRRALADVGPGDTIVVACSGGADSLALLAATVFEGRHDAWQVIGATVDHGLQEGSADHADRVVAQMRELGVAESVTARVRVDAPGIGPEAAAREARYAVLAQIAERFSARVVLLGHTMDDQAETVLLGLTRGSGGRSLQGMRRAFEVFRRPLLDLARAETETACVVQGIEFWSDPHNDEQRFSRVRVRTKVLPLLEEELGPGVAATLARTADQLRADTSYLDSVAASALESARQGDGLAVAALEPLADAIRSRVVRLAAVEAGAPSAELFHGHVLELVRLVTDWHGQKWVDLPGHLRALRRDGLLLFERGTAAG